MTSEKRYPTPPSFLLLNGLCPVITVRITEGQAKYYRGYMKKDIHPKYYEHAKVTCSCGNTFEVGSTKPEIHVEVCSACHPFYTGTAKFIDTAGRVDKFQERVKKAQEMKVKKNSKKENKEKKDERESKAPTPRS